MLTGTKGVCLHNHLGVRGWSEHITGCRNRIALHASRYSSHASFSPSSSFSPSFNIACLAVHSSVVVSLPNTRSALMQTHISASPSPTMKTPSPSFPFRQPSELAESIQLADIDPKELEERQKAIHKLLERAEFSKVGILFLIIFFVPLLRCSWLVTLSLCGCTALTRDVPRPGRVERVRVLYEWLLSCFKTCFVLRFNPHGFPDFGSLVLGINSLTRPFLQSS